MIPFCDVEVQPPRIMPDCVQASVSINAENTSSWSIPVSSGNLYEAVGELRCNMMTYYERVLRSGQVGQEEEQDSESDRGTYNI